MNDRVRFPAKPMVGVVGVATDGETLTNGLAGRHGGNLDDHWHGKGARIYFPVRQEGGMFAVGDMHATADDYDDALKLCAEEAAKLLVDEWDFTIEDAFIFLSVACDAGVAQACKPAPGGFGTIARFTIPKLDAAPAPFAVP
jgi:amidase